MDKIFDSINVRGGVNFPVLPTTYCDELSYLEVVSKLNEIVNELIGQCNLNTEDTNKIKEQWNELISSSEDGKNVLQQLEFIINKYNLDMSTEEDIYKLFELEKPTTDDSNEYATNPDIDNIFK